MKEETKKIVLGFLIPDIYGWYYTQILDGAIRACKKRNIALRIFTGSFLESPFPLEREKNSIYRLISQSSIDGLIIPTSTIAAYIEDSGFQEYFKRFSPLPLVSIGTPVAGHPQIGIDNEVGMVELISHLIEKHNYRNIAFVCGPEENDEAQIRLAAYIKTLEKYDIPFRENYVIPGLFSWESGIDAAKTILDQRRIQVDAIVCANDEMAFGVYSELSKRDLRIPQDIALTGFDNTISSASTFPPLSTVSQPIREQAAEAVEILEDIINNRETATIKILPTTMKIRSSCGCQSSKEVIWDKLSLDTKDLLSHSHHFRIHENEPWWKTSLTVKDSEYSYLERMWGQLINFILENDSEYAFFQELKDLIYHSKITNDQLKRIYAQVYSIFYWLKKIIPPHKYERMMKLLYGIEDLKIEVKLHLSALEVEKSSIGLWSINSFLEAMGQCLSLDDLKLTLKEGYIKQNTPGFYLVLYEGKKFALSHEEAPSKYSSLHMAYNGNTLEVLEYPKDFITAELLPDGKTYYKNDDIFYVLPITIQSSHYGYILVEHNPDLRVHLSTLYNRICTSFFTINQVEQIERTNRRLDYLNKNLERKVKERTFDLEEANDKLQSLDNLKNQFITNVTHDLRSPLMVIMNTALLSMRKNGEDSSLYPKDELIYNSSLKLKSTIDKLLDLAAMDAGGIPLNVKKINIKNFLSDLSKYYQSAVEDMGIRVDMLLMKEEVNDFYTDEGKLEQILSNIVSNAIKFVELETGEILIKLSVQDDNIRIDIIDNGIGIEEEDLQKIFNRFEQSSAGKESLFTGSGIGLAFSSQLSSLLKGRLNAFSPGKDLGSQFTLFLPLGKEHFAPEDFQTGMGQKTMRREIKKIFSLEAEEREERQGFFLHLEDKNTTQLWKDIYSAIILIVDDDASIRQIIYHCLSSAGYKNIILATNGLHGLNAIYQYKPDLVLCDYNMPVMGGEAFHDNLVQDENYKMIPFIFLSGMEDKQLILERKSLGALDYLMKPVDLNELQEIIKINLQRYFKEQKHQIYAYRDELTNLYNRRFLKKTFAKIISDKSLTDLSIVFFDIDHFKKFNDDHGHEMGDQVLKWTGELLLDYFRGTDFPVRYGGEEFLIILPQTSTTGALRVCQKIQGKLHSIDLEGCNKALRITASFGIANLVDHCDFINQKLGLEDINQLLKEKRNRKLGKMPEDLLQLMISMADQAMYDGKNSKCKDCGFTSHKEKNFPQGRCKECGSDNISKGRNQIHFYNH